MSASKRAVVLGCAALALMLFATATTLLNGPSVSVGPVVAPTAIYSGGTSALPAKPFVSSPPPAASGPDDIALLAVAGLDHGNPVIWTEYQNGVNPNGSPGPSGVSWSTIAGYDRATGHLVRALNVSGHVDGLTADPAHGVLIATTNEDANSALYVIYPVTGAVATYAYSPSPEVHGNGGTDSVAVRNGLLYITHSNPNDTTQAAEYVATLDQATLTATLTPVFSDNSVATNVITGVTASMALTDPDTNFVMPAASPRFAGDLATISQGDGLVIFTYDLSTTPRSHVVNVTDNVTGNIPPIDGLTVATCDQGTLYVVDAGGNTITALSTAGWPAGTVFVGEPHDNANPLIGTLDLWTGQITPLANHFVSPKGLLFVPGQGCDHDHHGDGDHDHGHDHGDDAPSWLGRWE